MNFTEFKYRVTESADAVVLYSVGVDDEKELENCINNLRENGINTENLTEDEATKMHLRHMVGGSTGVSNERCYKIGRGPRAHRCPRHLPRRGLAQVPDHHDALPLGRQRSG